MDILTNDIREGLSVLTQSEPIFDISLQYSGGLYPRRVLNDHFKDPESILSKIKKWTHISVEEVLFSDKNKNIQYKFAESNIESITNSVRFFMLRFTETYIMSASKAKNKKQTDLYKWYKLVLDTDKLKSNYSLSNDLWNITKWALNNQKDNLYQPGEVDLLVLLEAVKNRYINQYPIKV